MADRRKVTGHLPPEHIFGFCKTFRKTTKNSVLHLKRKTMGLQHFIYTTIGVDINIGIKSFYLYIPTFNPNPETQRLFKASVKSSFTLISETRTIGKKTISTDLDNQRDICLSPTISCASCAK